MRVTEKDKKLVELVERWGFLTIEDVIKICGFKNQNAAVWRLKRLTKNNIIKREKSILACYFYVPLDYRGIDLATLEHDQVAKHLCLRWSRDNQCGYQTARELRSAARVNDGVAGLTKKIPDFVLIKDGKKIACEVELTQKSLARQRENIERYVGCLMRKEFMQVNYFCGSVAILERLKLIIADKRMENFIRVSLIQDLEDLKNGKCSTAE